MQSVKALITAPVKNEPMPEGAIAMSVPKPGALGVSGANWMEGGVSGVEILAVAQDSPAEIAGLHVHDVITDVNGRKVRSNDDLATTLAQQGSGSKIVLGYMFKSNLGWMPKETLVILADR